MKKIMNVSDIDSTMNADIRNVKGSVILEFKVQDEDEKELSDTVEEALRQIRDRNYRAALY